MLKQQLSVVVPLLALLFGKSHAASRYGLLRVQHDDQARATIEVSPVSSNGGNSRQLLRDEDFYFSERNGRHLSFAFDEANLPMTTLVPSASPTGSATLPTAIDVAVDSIRPTIEASGKGDDEGAVTSGIEGVSSVEAGVGDSDEPASSGPSRSRINGAPTAMIAVAGTLAFAAVLVIAVKKIVPRASSSSSSASESGPEDHGV